MASRRRVDLRGILSDPDLRRELMVPTIQATQAREGIETSREQAERAYYVATERDCAAFFDLKRFRPRMEQDDRREMEFVRELRTETSEVRIDVRRTDFSSLAGKSLSFRWVHILAPLFQEYPPLDPGFADAKQGLISTESDRFVRLRWECPTEGPRFWVPYAKGGDFSRFYFDLYLAFDWTGDGADIKAIAAERYGSASRTVKCEDYYFRPGITWVEKTVKGMNARILPPGSIFNVAGPSAFPHVEADTDYLLGILNSNVAQACLECFSSRSWGVEYVGKIPIPQIPGAKKQEIVALARAIHDIKAFWDEGNEICTRFRAPWLLRHDLMDVASSVSACLNRLAESEATEETHIQKLYAELNDEVYKLYGIPDATRAIVDETLGKRPPEILWPQMEGKSIEQKRMEHVFRLLSYVVKRVVEADEDGVVPFTSVADEPSLLDRVHNELAALFPGHDVNRVEVEITNELKKNVKGYRKTNSIREWLENAFFEYHVSLYKNRPILWHLASNQGTVPFAFGALVHYHKFDKNRLAKLRAQYLRDAIEHFRREAGLADKAGRSEERLDSTLR